MKGHVPLGWEWGDSPKQVGDGLAEEPKEWPGAQQGGAGARGPGVCPPFLSSWGTGLPHLPQGRSPALSTAAFSFLITSTTTVWPRHSTCQPLKGLLGCHPLAHLAGTIPPEASGGRARPWPHQLLHLVLSRLLLSPWPWGLASCPAPSYQGCQQDALLACPPIFL